MILDSKRCAKEGHNPVVHNPVHGALVAVHGLDHAVEHRVKEELLRSLGVAVGKQYLEAYKGLWKPQIRGSEK
jgi:hypothetical protein